MLATFHVFCTMVSHGCSLTGRTSSFFSAAQKKGSSGGAAKPAAGGAAVEKTPEELAYEKELEDKFNKEASRNAPFPSAATVFS